MLTQFFAHSLFSNIKKKSILTNLKNLAHFFAYPLLLQILKTPLFILITIYIKTIIKIDKHKVKYITNACIPIIIIKNFLLFFFTVYKNERKEHKF